MDLGRPILLEAIQTALRRNPVVILTGPRQSGKTTLARELLPDTSPNYFDLEDPTSLARLDEPMTALASLEGLVVIDEVQRRPELFPILRVLADLRPTRTPTRRRFLILGSASGELLQQSSESLAGRVERIAIGGFSLAEVCADANAAPTDASHSSPPTARLWRRGGFPLSYLAETEEDSVAWRRQFIQTLLERDLPQWGVRIPATALLRMWTMVAHWHGQVWTSAEPARALGVTQMTIRRHLDLLTDALVLRQLQPWHANIGKRQVKSPKVYIRDTGLLHSLLGLDTEKELVSHPKIGASWEGFVIEQVLMTEPHDDAWFWATHQGAEIDLILRRGDRLYGIECKRADAPKMTPSIRHALDDLNLGRVAVIYPGTKRYRLADRVEVVPLETLRDRGMVFGVE